MPVLGAFGQAGGTAGEERRAKIVGLGKGQGGSWLGQKLPERHAFSAEHNDLRIADEFCELVRPIGKLGVADNQSRIDVADQRFDLAVGVIRIKRRHLGARRHTGIKRDRHLQAVTHHISDPLAGNAMLGEDARQRGHGLRILAVGQFAIEAGQRRRVGAMRGRISERVNDGRKVRIAGIATGRGDTRHGTFLGNYARVCNGRRSVLKP